MGCLITKASGEIASFISPTVTPIESARVYFSPTQLGEGTPSPENVREIVGRTSVELKQCGKNLLDPNIFTNIGYINNVNGAIVNTSDFKYCDSFILKKGNYIFTGINGNSATSNVRIHLYDKNGVWSKQITSQGKNYNTSYNIPFEITDNVSYIRLSVPKNLINGQLELGSTATPYEPYQGKIIPFSWKRLPDEYQEVEYIESDGTSYLDLNYVPVGDEKFELSFSYIATPSTNKSYLQLFGCREIGVSASNKNCWLGINSSDILYSRFGTVNIEDSILISKGKHAIIVDLKNTCLSIDNNNYYFNDSIISDITMSIYLGYMHTPTSGTSLSSSGIGQYNNFIIYNNNNEVIHNFIPCYRKFDNEIGMYDTVSQTFYTNQGTGTFTKGNDVFSDEVYGGYVDLVKGEIVDEYYSVPYTAWSVYKQNNGYICYKAVQPDHLGNWYCNVLNTYGSFSSNAMDRNIIQKHGSTLDSTGTLYMALDENVDISTVQVIYKRAVSAPITHPLPDYLKTQLQTLKNENTFWSDADSVEIEYGLAETFDIQKAKRKIIMNQPHVETISGDAVSFTTDMKAPLKECKVSFMPVQEGTGDPSPSNVRNIVGWNGVSVKNGENTYSIDWTDDVGTVYGGYVDLVSGELVQTKAMITIDENARILANGSRGVYYPLPDEYKTKVSPIVDILSEIGTGHGDRLHPMQCCINSAGTNFLFKIYEDDQSATTAKTFLQDNPLHVVLELAEPITYQLTPEQLITLKGQNNLWADTNGTIDVKYWKH